MPLNLNPNYATAFGYLRGSAFTPPPRVGIQKLTATTFNAIVADPPGSGNIVVEITFGALYPP